MKRIVVLVLLTLLTPLAAHATSIVLPTDEQLADKSPVIVSGTVLSTMPVDRDGAIWTDTRIAVSRAIKGQVEETITIHEIGGVLADRFTKVFGGPEFAEGERVLVFLEEAPGGGYRVMDLFAGKFGEGKTVDGRRMWLRRDTTAEVVFLDANLSPTQVKNVQRDAHGFENFLDDHVAGREARTDYRIENPVLAEEGGSGKLRSDFTLISTGVYRWSRFDQGNYATWYHGGTQPGYSGNGISELQTAMGVWTGYGQAKILYGYSGAINVAMKGLGARNNVNEVLFGDPLNEIAGTWNPQTGGIVGRGGFNGYTGGPTFNAPFQADAAHPAGPMASFEILEANLVIQDGVSPSKNISSKSLAEIVAHEFGHTLGFGHSATNTALMYEFVTDLGPSLRPDDELGARWLYPNSGGPSNPTAPAAPSNLVAVPSGSNVDVSWKDNANNETAQTIYLAQGSGAFTAYRNLVANATADRLGPLAAGSYRAYVIASNTVGNSAASNTVTFTIVPPPVALFSVNPPGGNAGTTNFTFYDESTGVVTSRVWQFGDGGTATTSVASHTYAASGTYPVTLTVNGPGGSSHVTKNVTVNGPLNPQFGWNPLLPTPGSTVHFVDESGGAPTSWQWSFGDNSTSTLQNPTKIFGTEGTYTVTLTVVRNNVSASTSRVVNVVHGTPGTQLPVAAFEVAASTLAPGTPIVFTDRSTGTPVVWQWAFGDGHTSNDQSPTHVYATPGPYTVTLTATNTAGSSQMSKQVEISGIVPYRGLISAAAQTEGLGGTSWRTELSLFNAGLEGANVTLTYLPTLAEKTIYLAARQSVTYSNALLDVFGLGTGAGAVTIDAESAGSSAQLRVTSRTFTGGDNGTYGQSVPDVQSAQLGKTLYITGIKSNAAFRTNIGLVNRAEAELSATLTLFARNGDTIATKNVILPKTSFQQNALWALFPEVNGVAHGALSLKIATSTPDAISAYASVVDNVSQDPIYIQAVGEPQGYSLTIPAVGRTAGANQTFWRSDLTFFNPSTENMTLVLRYGNAEREVSVGAGDTEVVENVLASFGIEAGLGALFVSWTTNAAPIVTSSTYTTKESGGTYGQSIDPLATLKTKMFVPGLRNDGSYRSNIGFVNGGGEAETFWVVVLSPSGNELARGTVTLDPDAQVQYSVSSLFPNVNSSSFTLMVEGDANAQLFAYGSMVDNASGDPVFFAGQ